MTLRHGLAYALEVADGLNSGLRDDRGRAVSSDISKITVWLIRPCCLKQDMRRLHTISTLTIRSVYLI